MGFDDKLVPSKELPHFVEKYPTKVCCLCNLGEMSALGQGDFMRVKTTQKNLEEALEIESLKTTEKFSTEDMSQPYRRYKTNNKSKLLSNKEYVNELDKIGHSDLISGIYSLIDGDFLYVHKMCAMWSSEITLDTDNKMQNIEQITAKALKMQCAFCGAFGASIYCKMKCKQIYHLPCATACALLITSQRALFCPDHINQAHLVYTDLNIKCQQCFCHGDITKLVMCSTCGCHYHTTCVGLPNQPDTKSGWNCSQCTRCQICRQHDTNESRTLMCEQCQKVYHATCLRPAISSIPKYGWKCNRCRICTDCGSRTPGSGSSSRWHCHYTICDSCYQQRNKGFSCPICHKAYRAAAHKEMVKCSSCNRFVHGTCDYDAELTTYHRRKESNPDYDYVCPQCIKRTSNEIEIDFANTAHSYTDIDTTSTLMKFPDQGKNFDVDFMDRRYDDTIVDDGQKAVKKRFGFKEITRRGGKTCLVKASTLSQLGRKRAKGKTRHFLILNGTYHVLDGDRESFRSNDDNLAIDKKFVICSAKDEFMLSQDLCIMCGAVGYEKELCLIACAQCGQCFHPFCVNVKLSQVILEKGWRCLDCTVCEGCGQRNDESRLLLCDECDISFHIYCVSPPLEAVPHGNWRCKWCSVCQKCGRNSPGINSEWKNGLMECGPCASKNVCCICLEPYIENDLLIKCTNCERWLHCHCDSIKSEEEAEIFNTVEYQCKICRPKEKSLAYLVASKGDIGSKVDNSIKLCKQMSTNSKYNISIDRAALRVTEDYESSESLHWVDGVCINERGLNLIKSLTTEVKKKRKTRSSNEVQKDLGILATIESVVSGSSFRLTENEDFELKDSSQNRMEDNMTSKSESTNTAFESNDKGMNILRKKRQRNLQKLGIGGFSVRNRTFKKNNDEKVSSTPGNTNIPDAEKKKKSLKKKFKTKLSESYPAYLQEAFFGKQILGLNEVEIKNACGSDSSDEVFDELEFSLQYSKLDENRVLHNKTTHSSEEKSIACDESRSSCEVGINRFSPNLAKAAYNCDYSTHNLQKNSTLQKPVGLLNEATSESSGNWRSVGNANLSADQDMLSVQRHNFVHTDKPQLLVVQDFYPNTVSHNINQINIQQREDNLYTKQGEIMIDEANCTLQKISKISGEHIEAIVAGTQKTAEKMRRDEELGTMATISAVLYSNTQHPDLRESYPVWTDRCKQILKRWRSLSTEKKAPFLQRAKDNRSALRLRRTQQEHERSSVQNKSLREQEHERIWKLHQAKLKEISDDGPKIDDKSTDGNFNESGQISPPKCSFANKSIFGDILTSEMPSSKVCPAAYTQPTNNSSNTIADEGQSFVEDGGNKQLRTLLQKHPSSEKIENLLISAERDNDAEQCLPGGENNNSENRNPSASIASKKVPTMRTCLKIKQEQRFINEVPRPKHRAQVSNRSELSVKEPERLDQDAENAGFVDILGGFGEGDDDDLLKSLTTEMGDDFNILEYADPELDVIATNQNLLGKLDFDDGTNNN